MKTILILLFNCLLLVIACSNANAQKSYPDKAVTIIVPFAAGGVSDAVARYYAQRLTSRMGQTFYVENKVGAGGTIGTDLLSHASPDGYTLGIFLDSNTIAPAVYKKLGSDPIKDFTPIAMLAEGQHVIIAHPSFPPNTMKELIEYAKNNPGEPYASTGQGTAQHLGMEMIQLKAGIKLTHVPYKGGGQAITDLAGGQIKFGILGIAPVLPFVKTGQLKVIAVTGEKRSPIFPGIPTVSETLPGITTLQWFGIVAPAGLPTPIQQKLFREFTAITKEPETEKKLAGLGLETYVNKDPSEFTSFMEKDLAKWPQIIKATGIKPE